MGMYLPRIQPEAGRYVAPPLHPVALQVFEVIETVYKRISLVRKLGEWTIKDEKLKSELKNVLNAIEGAAKTRNNVVHANWGISGDRLDALILQPVFGHSMVYTREDFELILEQIRTAIKLLGNFESRVRKWEMIQAEL
jgi:hypothetical protein